jgi:hypothetical protein
VWQLQTIDAKVTNTYDAVLGVRKLLDQMWSDQSLLVSIQLRKMPLATPAQPQWFWDEGAEVPSLADQEPASGPVFLLSRQERYCIKVLLLHKMGQSLPPVEIRRIAVIRQGVGVTEVSVS